MRVAGQGYLLCHDTAKIISDQLRQLSCRELRSLEQARRSPRMASNTDENRSKNRVTLHLQNGPIFTRKICTTGIQLYNPLSTIILKCLSHKCLICSCLWKAKICHRIQWTMRRSQWHWLSSHDMDASKKIVLTTENIQFYVELFIGERDQKAKDWQTL